MGKKEKAKEAERGREQKAERNNVLRKIRKIKMVRRQERDQKSF